MENICPHEKCTLCMACANSCPVDAIGLYTDENGYEKLVIDKQKCIDCGKCKKVCQRRTSVIKAEPKKVFAAQIENKERVGRSASGGAFQALAQAVLEACGVCYGCAFSRENDLFYAKHTRVDSIEQLNPVLNSKYVPSIIGDTYREVKRDLEAGKIVLFSGTPCQIQGLKAFLNCEHENLLTADIICHGVTSTKLFNDYIAETEKRKRIRIVDFCFRDKSVSWGLNFCYNYYKSKDRKKRIVTKRCPREESSYIIHYLRGNIFRQNCYACELSCESRVGDFTLGDYWGIEQENPELVTKTKPGIALKKGVSCVMVNTEKAEKFLNVLEQKMILHEISYGSVTAHNGNLRAPSKMGRGRDLFLQKYQQEGYKAIEDSYQTSVGKKMLAYKIKNILKSCLPDKVRIWIYNTPALSRLVFHD